MNKLYTLATLFVFLSTASQAQKLSIGVKGGLSLVDVAVVAVPDGSESEDSYFEMRPSYYLGAFGTFGLNNRSYLQADLLYANKGFKSGDPRGSNSNIHLHYLTLPVLFNYKFLEWLHVGVGGELGYRFAARSKSDDRNVDVDFIYKRKWDFGLAAGLIYKLHEKLDLGLRYNHGLSHIFGERGYLTDINGNKTSKGPIYQNRVLQFSVGYVFGGSRAVND